MLAAGRIRPSYARTEQGPDIGRLELPDTRLTEFVVLTIAFGHRKRCDLGFCNGS
jgi:hypothetical protein